MSDNKYLHIDYTPQSGWVLSIMTVLQRSTNPVLRKTWDTWSDTPLKDFGFAITTRMAILAVCIRRLNESVARLRDEVKNDLPQVEACLKGGYVFRPRDSALVYQVLADMDAFIFETRSLYEILGKFLVTLFGALFGRKLTEDDILRLLKDNKINTDWIESLREARKLFFHETAPWLALRIGNDMQQIDPVLVKQHAAILQDSMIVQFEELRSIYEGFVRATTELHRFLLEQIRLAESKTP